MSNQNKSIFNFFRKEYEEKSNQNQGWNTPPDFIFEDAINAVNSKKGKKRRFLLFITLAGALITSVLITQLYLSDRIDNIEQRVNTLDQDKHLDKTPSNTAEAISVTEGNIAAKNETVIDATHSQTKNLSKRVRNTSTKTKGPSPRATDHTLLVDYSEVTNQIRKATNLIEPSSSSSLFENTEAKADTKESRSAIPSTSTIASRKINSLAHKAIVPQLPSNTTLPQATAPTDDIESKKWTVALLGKVNYSSLKMDGPADNSQTLTLYDKYYTGYGAQLNTALELTNKFSVIGSISYDKMKNRSLVNCTMPYDDSNESFMNDDMSMYRLDTEISTPMGELEDRMRFMVDPLAYANGTPIIQNSTILQSISILGLHLGPQYSLVKSNKLEWNASLQVGINYINKMLTTVSSEYTIMGSTMSTNEMVAESLDSMQKTSSSLALSSNISYKLGDNYSLSFGISNMRSLSSLRSFTPTTNLINWSSQLGISKKF